MFWGSVGPKGVGKLAVWDGKVNTEMYVEILQDCCVYRVPYSFVSLLFRRFVINRTVFWFVLLSIVLVIVFAEVTSTVECLCSWGV